MTQARKLGPKTLEIHGSMLFTDTELRPSLHRVIAGSLGTPEQGKRRFDGEEEGFIYTRINNPTVDRLERQLALMEEAEACLATSSGMAAIKMVALYFACKQGKVNYCALEGPSWDNPTVSQFRCDAPSGGIASSNRLYGGTYNLFKERLPRLGIDIHFVEDPFSLTAWKSAIDVGGTSMMYVENPSNPLLDVFDIRRIACLAHKYGVPLVVDSTLATPVLHKPLRHGADIVVHSTSKYMGDGEVIGGAVLGKKKIIDDLRKGWFRDCGPCISPDNAQIMMYHIETLHDRMRTHCRNAEKVAHFLVRHKKVKNVFYPTQGSRAKENARLMPNGFGGLLSFDVGTLKRARDVVRKLKLFWHAANIGEARSLVLIPADTTHGQMTPKERMRAGIFDGMIRLAIGGEDYRDLINDLAQALASI